MKDLAKIVQSVENFLNTPTEEILQIRKGHLSAKQLKEAREIVQKNSKILEPYEYSISCNGCVYTAVCSEILYGHCDYYGPVSPPKYIPDSDEDRCVGVFCEMFIPEFFRGIKTFEDVPKYAKD